MVVSAMTEAGLNTVNLSMMSTFQQVLLWVLILVGSAVFVSVGTVLTRKRVFEQRFKNIVKAQKEGRRRSRSRGRDGELGGVKERVKVEEPGHGRVFESRHSGPRDPTTGHSQDGLAAEAPSLQQLDRGDEEAVVVEDEPHSPVLQFAPQGEHHRVLSFVGVGAHPNSSAYSSPRPPSNLLNRSSSKHLPSKQSPTGTEEGLDTSQYPHYLTRHTTGRNAQFYGLSRAEREHLGGVEYRAITLLAYVVPIYFVAWQVLGCVGLGAYMAHNKAGVAERNGINAWYVLPFSV